MTPNPALTITLGAQAGDGESHWLRLEQVEMADEGATMEQAAALIDALYGIEPCVGMGTGGNEADNEALPDETEFLKKARELLKLGACEESVIWDAEVDVYRSHQTDGYSLQGERITVGETTPMSRAVTETVELDGASYDLQWPYGGDISVSGGAVVADVRGSTVNFSAPVRGLIRIRYTAVWDRVRIRVRPAGRGQGDPLAGLHYVAGDNTGKTSDDDAASVVAFWRDLAAECRLTRPPVDDQGLEMVEIQRLCNRKTDWHVKGDCWQTIETYNICNCSGRESPDVPGREDVDAPCPEGVRPDSFLGVERRRGEYVDCPGEDRELLNDPDFYRSRCCDEPYQNLPRCRVTREPHRGGAEIENGPEYWRDIYGPTVRMIPITPEGGCGEIIRKWDVPMWRDCGDDQDCASAPHPRLPGLLIIAAGSDFELTVTGGKAPFVWRVPRILDTIGESQDNGRTIFLHAGEEYGASTVYVTDACGREASCRVRTPDDIASGEDDDPTKCYQAELYLWHYCEMDVIRPRCNRTELRRQEDGTWKNVCVEYRLNCLLYRMFPSWGLIREILIDEYMSYPSIVRTRVTDFSFRTYTESQWERMRDLAKRDDEYARFYAEVTEERDYSFAGDVIARLRAANPDARYAPAGVNSYYETITSKVNGEEREKTRKYYYIIDLYVVKAFKRSGGQPC